MTQERWPKIRGPWSEADVRRFLDDSVIPMRIGVHSSAGSPLVMSVWFVLDGAQILGATRPTSILARRLELGAECGFEIAADSPPYRGVRGHARVELDRDAGGATLDRLLVRYLGSLAGPLAESLRARAQDEVCLRLRPLSLVTWDYSHRMAPGRSTPADA